MLQLRPLPPHSSDAMICSFECTFCRNCVDHVLFNACPNCGGGFAPRPFRPQHNWRGDNCLAFHPASDRRIHRPVDAASHAAFARTIRTLAREQR